MRLVILMGLIALAMSIAACGGSGAKNRPGTPTVKGSIAGKFVANNVLPGGATFSAALYKKGDANPTSTQTPTADGDDLAFSFADLALGTYYVQLRATLAAGGASSLGRTSSQGAHTIVLNQTGDLTISTSSPDLSGVSVSAVGTDGTISGIVQVAGEYPAGKVVFVWVYRTDVALPPGPPDGVNSKTFDVPSSLIENNQFRYDIENISYGE